MTENRTSYSPYNYCSNNPINRIDPSGALDTKYEDEQHRLLLETNDGSDAVVTVSNDKRAGFDAAVKGTKNTDDVSWNNSMKRYALGFELSGAQESALSSLNSDWSRRNAISFWQNPTAGNASAFAFSEALSQWTNPELVVGGLSVGIAGLASLGNAKITNPVPSRLARVIPADINSSTLGAIGVEDVFVTATNDIAGLNASQIAKRLTIPNSSSGFRVIEFDTPGVGLSSPINRTNPGFVGFGRTAGGAREFTIPNQVIPNGSTTRIIP